MIMLKIFNLITSKTTLYLLKEEEKFFKKEKENFNFILNTINNSKINLVIKTEAEIKKEKLFNETISFLGNKSFMFFPFDKTNLWGSYNFLTEYLKIDGFKYKNESFIKLLLKLDRDKDLTGKNRILYFLPFLIIKSNYFPTNKIESLLSYFPKFVAKDKSFYKKKILGSYNNIIPKSKNFYEKFDFVLKNLSNDYSKKIFNIWVNGKAEDIWFNYFQKVQIQMQYADKVKLDKDSIILNAGVFNGVEILLFDGVKKIYNIDPDGKKFLEEEPLEIVNKSETENIFIKFPLYEFLDNKNKIINTQVKTLNEIVKENKINRIDLIKSDVEGSERYMVEDLINLSEKFRPQLAISIYHKNRGIDDKLIDGVEIPYKLMKSLKNYTYFIEHYSFERQELILICLPL
jgi:FkbM family methyltransferase